MIKIIDNHIFQITFKNGYTVSIQIGGGSYNDNYDKEYLIGQERNQKETTAITAEVVVFDQTDNIVRVSGSKHWVMGWQKPEQILDILNQVSKCVKCSNNYSR